jgi:hypothetical protein
MRLINHRQQVTKGNANWNHTVTLEGKLEDQSDTNFIYWFQLHLQKNFKLKLEDYNVWNLTAEQENQKVWKWSKDSMRENFKSRCKLAGYPQGNI